MTGREKRGPLSTERVQSSRSWSMEEDMNTTHGTRSPRRRYHPFLRELSRRPSSIHITLRGGEGGHNLLRYWQSTLQTLLATYYKSVGTIIVLKRFIGPVITVNNMSADDDRLANRVLFAKVLGPGRGEPKSYPAHCKPEAKQLRAEILRRDGSARPTHWGRDRMVNFPSSDASAYGSFFI